MQQKEEICNGCGDPADLFLNLAKDLHSLKHPLAHFVPLQTYLCKTCAYSYMMLFNTELAKTQKKKRSRAQPDA